MNTFALFQADDTAQSDTITYYDRNAHVYAKATLNVDMEGIYDRFLPHLAPGGRILDAGSGSGRDTIAFVRRGFIVEAFDASKELCDISTELTGVQAEVLRFQAFEREARYDGIWACASLLHVPASELPDVLQRLWRSLKSGGAFYLSFKHGRAQRVAEDGRFFQDLDESTLRRLVAGLDSARVVDLWISTGEDTQQGHAEWLNAILIKDDSETA